MTEPPPVDMEAALLDPASTFSSPEALLLHPTLTREQKIEILRRWEYDAAEVCVAVEEGMPGGETGMLGRILVALDQLTGGIDPERPGPTKQHGLDRRAVRPGEGSGT